MAFLELNRIEKTFGRTVVVQPFDLHVEKGEFVSFLGPSGCGKTTTLRMIAGFETPSAGEIKINGVDIHNTPPNKRNVGMVFQSYALFPNLTVRENIGFGLKIAHKSEAEREERVAEMLDLIHMEDFGARYPYQLSGGQQQRVALARALAIRPQVLLLDEPLSALDAKIRVRLRAEIRAIQQKLGITTVYVTHDQEEALSLSDRVVVMNDGRIEQIGTPFEIYNKPATPFAASFIGTLNFFQARVVDPERGELSMDGQEIITVGRLGLSEGDLVRLALRPEMISVHNGNPGDNQLTGTLRSIMFLGTLVRITVRVGQSDLIMDVLNNTRFSYPRPGEQMRLYFPREACLILEQSGKLDGGLLPDGLLNTPLTAL